MEITRPTIMEVDLRAFEYNILQIKKYLKKDIKIMPVIKAKAYGTYINTCNEILNQFEIVAVATVDEGVYLRNNGYEKEIFVLNQPYKDEIEKIIKYNLTVGVSSNEFVEALGENKEEVKIHIEIGTGMGRTGIHPSRTKEYIEKVSEFSNIKIEGIYTHLSSADNDFKYTKEQLQSFNTSLKVAKSMLKNIKYIHTCASNGILNFPEGYYNLVRPGIILYGYKSSDDTYEKMNLKPVCKLRSKITLLKVVKEGTSIGYSRKYITDTERKIATVPIGYADGLRRCLSNKGFVVINGKKAPIVGNICMDGFMADVTNIENVKVGDNVYIWDNELITLDEVASMCDTINYEIMSTISERVPRIFIK